ncbi:aminoglycoside phosphotransferase [Saccharomonospora sp. CUA-673]|nr:aminoglycoside phosphotransferase [Saccharomonospora sp. CUA-673]
MDSDPRGATLLRFTNNAVYALGDREVVVRIVGTPALRHRVDKVVQVARHLERHGVPAVRLVSDVEQPVRVGDYLATVWHRVPDTGRRAGAAELAALLRSMHATGLDGASDGASDGTGVDGLGELTPWEPLDDVRVRLDAAGPELAPADRAFLLDRCDELDALVAELDFPLASTLAHGDAHAGNVIVGPDGPVLCDFDSACVGPPEWDLTPVAVGCLRFGDPPSWHGELAEGYGFDVTAWEGFDVLRAVRELKLATSVLPIAGRDEAVRAELGRRIADLRSADTHQQWIRYH